jgi:four helix bundle protein
MSRPPAQRFQDLEMWQKSHSLTVRVYKLTKAFPREEIFGLTAQMRRAAISVPANIAEGFSKRGRIDKARVMNIAQASLEELRYYFILARDLTYLSRTETDADLDEVARMLGAYTSTLRG